MKKERRPEASSLLDIVRSGIEAGADDDRLTGCINDILTCLIHSAVEEERTRTRILIERCRMMYSNRADEDRQKGKAPRDDYGVYLNPDEKSSCDKAAACEYVAFVIKEWDIKSD